MSAYRNANARVYEYETSPRKLKPNNTKNKRIAKQVKTSKSVKTNKAALVKWVCMIILFLSLAMCMAYRNSLIDESFAELKKSEEKLATIKKENEQLEVSIEKNLNLSEVEKIASEKLGMQKASSGQTKYISLPKKDYIEIATEEVKKDESQNIFTNLIEIIKSIF